MTGTIIPARRMPSRREQRQLYLTQTTAHKSLSLCESGQQQWQDPVKMVMKLKASIKAGMS